MARCFGHHAVCVGDEELCAPPASHVKMRAISLNSILLIALAAAWPVLAQGNTGELRLKVADPNGLGLKASVIVSSVAN